jgi:hypothetical protein
MLNMYKMVDYIEYFYNVSMNIETGSLSVILTTFSFFL